MMLSSYAATDRADRRRYSIYTLLVLLTLAITCGRILTARSRDGHTPFFSANDRSRWCTISSLVDEGTYAIDKVHTRPGWKTIDMVRHADASGALHYYSSKPPLMATLLAPLYWLIRQLTGVTFAEHPFFVGRTILLITNVPLLLLYFGLLRQLIERYGTTDFGRIFTFASAAFGTFLTTFASTLNNHLPAAVCVLATLASLSRIANFGVECVGVRLPWVFAACGFAASFAVTSELPALSLFLLVSATVFWLAPRNALVYFAPAAILVGVAFFATNYLAHGSFRPPYAHRETGNNWYQYPGSYWVENRRGVDLGEPSRLVYLTHCLVGHHGFFSLTPIWCLSVLGGYRWLRERDRQKQYLAMLGFGLLLVCVGFYVFQRPLIDRNYGGVTSGLRWLFWLIPIWTLLLLPAGDALSKSSRGRYVSWILFALSVFSATIPFANPWTHPWLYQGYLWWCGIS